MPYLPILSQGAGALPLVGWNPDTHTSELVQIFAIYDVVAANRVDVDNTGTFRAPMTTLGLKAE